MCWCSTMSAEQGMCVSNHKASSAEQRRNEQRLRKLVVGENTRCADCLLPLEFRNAWASINLGCYMCIQCSGVHRSLGTHLSKVRAVAADDWNDDWVDNMERWGNERAAAFWEARPPRHRPVQAFGDSATRGLRDYIRVRAVCRPEPARPLPVQAMCDSLHPARKLPPAIRLLMPRRPLARVRVHSPAASLDAPASPLRTISPVRAPPPPGQVRPSDVCCSRRAGRLAAQLNDGQRVEPSL